MQEIVVIVVAENAGEKTNILVHVELDDYRKCCANDVTRSSCLPEAVVGLPPTFESQFQSNDVPGLDHPFSLSYSFPPSSSESSHL